MGFVQVVNWQPRSQGISPVPLSAVKSPGNEVAQYTTFDILKFSLIVTCDQALF